MADNGWMYPGGSGLSGFLASSKFQRAATGLALGGVVSQAIGAFYSVKSQQYQAKSQALNLEFQAGMASMAARNAELDAQHVLQAGQEEAGRAGLQYGQAKQGTRARQAAAGVQGGVGSAAEIAASIEYSKEADLITINKNAVRAANARRAAGIDAANQSLLARVGAKGFRRTASVMSPGLAAFTRLLAGGRQGASQGGQAERQRLFYKSRGVG